MGIELNAGSGGASVATDLIGTEHFQVVKLAFGTAAAATRVEDQNRLPIYGSVSILGTVPITGATTGTVFITSTVAVDGSVSVIGGVIAGHRNSKRARHYEHW